MKYNKITILHIGYCPNDKASGVAVAIPNHLKHQAMSSKLKIGFLNLCNNEQLKIKKIKIFPFKDYKTIDSLPNQFSKPDLVVFHEIYRIPFLNLSKELIQKKIPYIIIPHGGLTKEAQHQKKIKKIIGNMLLFNKYIYSANAIQFLSLSEEKRSKRFIKKQQIIISGSGIEFPDIQYKIHTPLRIVFIGRYDIYFKGLDLLLDSINMIASKLNKESVKVELYGIGNKNDEKYIRTYLKKNNMYNICQVNGPVFDHDKDNVLKNTDIFVQPSRSEGQPLGIIEALAYGIPVIITPGTGLIEDVNKYHYGYGTDFNTKRLAETILTAVKEKEKLITMSKNARLYAKNNYDWKVIINKLLIDYEKIIRRS